MNKENMLVLPTHIVFVDKNIETNIKIQEDLVQDISKTIKKLFIETGETKPTFFILGNAPLGQYNDECAMMVFSPPYFATEKDKNLTKNIVQQLAQQIKAFAIIFVSETWIAGNLKTSEHISIKDHPNKKEAITITTEHKIHGESVWTAEIKRDALGSPIVGSFKKQDFTEMKGRFFNLLPVPPKSELN